MSGTELHKHIHMKTCTVRLRVMTTQDYVNRVSGVGVGASKVRHAYDGGLSVELGEA